MAGQVHITKIVLFCVIIILVAPAFLFLFFVIIVLVTPSLFLLYFVIIDCTTSTPFQVTPGILATSLASLKRSPLSLILY